MALLMAFSYFFLVLCWLQTCSLCFATLDTLEQGKSLSVEKYLNHVLVSQNGVFSAGFFPVGDNAFCFAVWINKYAVLTVVWMANRDQPVNGRRSKLSLLKTGNLILLDAGPVTIWTTDNFAFPSSTTIAQYCPEVSSRYWPLAWLSNIQAGRTEYNTSRVAVLNSSGYFSSSDDFKFSSVDVGVKCLRRLTLDPDGNLRLYSLKRQMGDVLFRGNLALIHAKYMAFNGDMYLKLPKGTPFSGNILYKAARLDCPNEIPQRLNLTYAKSHDNESLKVLFFFATALGGLEMIFIFLGCYLMVRADREYEVAKQGYSLAATVFKRFNYADLKQQLMVSL
ncbi:hypothetical protein GH714_031113 [Hevea brasiliensis]|uniref:Bulb-type lectin domain-containing protein n=1 Tax=Hevea brasiliensis TaxID=3981 RepID=A0A6A6LG33_HEVBR|nr:hypothetical protein GH714_031113 [Hevea brasiliensis]